MGIIVLLHFLTHVLIRIAWDSLPAREWTKQMRRERGLPNLPPGSASVPPLLNRMLTRTELWCVNMCFVRFRHLPNIQARRVKLKFLQSWRLFFVKKNCCQTVLFARDRPIRIIQIICKKNCQICTKLAPALSPGFQTHAHDAHSPRQNHINVNSHLTHRDLRDEKKNYSEHKLFSERHKMSAYNIMLSTKCQHGTTALINVKRGPLPASSSTFTSFFGGVWNNLCKFQGVPQNQQYSEEIPLQVKSSS